MGGVGNLFQLRFILLVQVLNNEVETVNSIQNNIDSL